VVRVGTSDDRVVSSRAGKLKRAPYRGDVDPGDAAESERDWVQTDVPEDVHPGIDVPEADAWEQALPAPVDDDDHR
jgi:hypothetical protein